DPGPGIRDPGSGTRDQGPGTCFCIQPGRTTEGSHGNLLVMRWRGVVRLDRVTAVALRLELADAGIELDHTPSELEHHLVELAQLLGLVGEALFEGDHAIFHGAHPTRARRRRPRRRS